MTIPKRIVDPSVQMFPEALGQAPGRGRLQGRHVLIVGAGQRESDEADPPMGNGRAMSLLAAREGAQVVCADVNEAAAQATVDLLASEGLKAHTLVADVGVPEQALQMVDQAKAMMGKLDGMVLNVGISRRFNLHDIPADAWDEVFAVNVRAHMLACQRALKVMEPGSSIVLISSVASMRNTGRNPAYEASKAALLSLARAVAVHGHEAGIRCNVIAPGFIDTPMGRSASRARPDRAQQAPFGRQGTAWEVAYPTIFLISHEASYINAQTIVVDGGSVNNIVR